MTGSGERLHVDALRKDRHIKNIRQQMLPALFDGAGRILRSSDASPGNVMNGEGLGVMLSLTKISHSLM
jgi:hypothetical protein